MKTNIDKVFEVSLILKGLDGFIELIGGFCLVFIPSSAINHIAESLTKNELAKNPHSFIANHILSYSHHLSSSSITFGAIYLLFHAVVKIFLVAAILKDKIWAYPWLIAFLITFIIYQIYRIVIKFSTGLVLLTIFDMFLTCLTIIEYKKHRLRTQEVNGVDPKQ
jgi:uncharacterized membrane protein